jgi:hypothetical protein
MLLAAGAPGAHEGNLSLLQSVDGFDKYLARNQNGNSHAGAPAGPHV